MTPGVMRSVVGWFLRVAVPQMVFAICVSFTLAVSVPVSTHAYDTAAPMYDGASHSAQAHTGEAMLLTAGRVPEGAQRAVATATGPLSVVLLKSVAANSAGAGSIRGVNPLGGDMNCVNCAVATDSTLAGNPASALLSGPKPISVLEDLYGGSFVRVAGSSEIEGMLAGAGNGARGIVYGSRADGVGHVFNAVNQGGTIRFLDGQTGGAASFSGYDGFWFLRTG